MVGRKIDSLAVGRRWLSNNLWVYASIRVTQEGQTLHITLVRPAGFKSPRTCLRPTRKIRGIRLIPPTAYVFRFSQSDVFNGPDHPVSAERD